MMINNQYEIEDMVRQQNKDVQDGINRKAVEVDSEETSIDRVRNFVLSHAEFLNSEIDEHMHKHKGQMSWRSRISDIRKELKLRGGDIDCIPVDVKRGLHKYIVKLSQ